MVNLKFTSDIVSSLRNSLQTPFQFLSQNQRSILLKHTNWNNRVASVFIPLCNVNNEASILYTLRSQLVSTHKGHVSFPGGHLEENETPREAALRETNEELGNFADLDILGECVYLPAVTGTKVYPIVGWVNDELTDDFLTVTPEPDEVELVFHATIRELINNQDSERLGPRNTNMPFFQIDNKPKIWGLTAFMTKHILDDLLIPTFNDHYNIDLKIRNEIENNEINEVDYRENKNHNEDNNNEEKKNNNNENIPISKY